MYLETIGITNYRDFSLQIRFHRKFDIYFRQNTKKSHEFRRNMFALLLHSTVMGNSLSLMFWWITRGLLVSLQYVTRALTLGFLQFSLALLVSSTRLVSFTHWLTEFLKSTTPQLDGKKIFGNYR